MRIGGSFAPPLSDETLAEYEDRIGGMPDSAVKDALNTLHDLCARWWELPEPPHGPQRPHPSGIGAIVPLHADHAKELDPLTPWPHELEAMAALFDTIDRDAAARNSEKCQQWTTRVIEHVHQKHFPDGCPTPEEMDTLRKFGVEVSGWELKAATAHEEIALAGSTKTHPEVPRPVLESTYDRDMAHHLLWHAKELDLSREPITSDKI